MCLVVHAGQVLEIEVGIDLRCAQVGMAEQFLYRSQVVAGFQYVRGKGVAQHMGMQRYADPLLQRTFFQSLLNTAVAESPAVAADE